MLGGTLIRQNKRDSRERLILAGIEIFARHGFTGTTTRMLARHAGCNLSAIPYYFGGKKGLYHAVFQEIIGFIKESTGPVFEPVYTFLNQGGQEPEKALYFLKNILGTMSETICGEPRAVSFAKLIVNEQMMPSDAFDFIYENHMKNFMDILSRLIIIITGNQDKRWAGLKASTLMGQVLIFRTARESIVRFLNIEGYGREEALEIRGVVTAAIEGCLAVSTVKFEKEICHG